ncbi:MAG: hypothetical protein WC641_05345 [Patescibacteria group bacterium]
MKKIIAVLALVALVGAGCNQNQPVAQPTRQPAKIACDVLSGAEAATALGAVVEKGKSNEIQEGDVKVTTCAYATLVAPVKIMTLLLRRAENRAAAEEAFQEAKSQSRDQSGVEPQDILGLGDAAYWVGGSLNQLNVRKNEYWIILSAVNWQGESLPGLEQTARLVIPKL